MCATLAAIGCGSLGPVAALAPRGLPVWAIVMTVIAAAGLRHSGAGGMRRGVSVQTVTVGGLLLLACVSTLWSPSSRAVATVVELGYIALGAAVIGRWATALDAQEADRAIGWLLSGLAAGTLVFSVEAAFDHPLHRWWNTVPDDLDMDMTNVPKRTAAVLSLLAWAGGLALHRRVGGWAGPALLVVCTAGSMLLSSRSATLGLVAGLAAFGLATLSPLWSRRAVGGVLIAGFVLAVPLGLAAGQTLDAGYADWLFPSARHRLEIWGHAAWRVLEAPLFGHGIDASRALRPEAGEWSRFGTLTDSLLPLHPHNGFLQVWLELGLAGSTLVVVASLLMLSATRRLGTEAQPYALGLFAAGLAMANTAYGLWQAWWMAGYLAAGTMLLAAQCAGNRR
ncbi:O-antigen ligase family protein [Azospirillum sp. RWY-5-1]|uniref:O-antigen ligase family protein n=1 Tax=Azospirillum oleiclasticum TaxID=2735135 RepID=A0ABX2TF96_9PROT|nr:O-antigen ligase family protein [Azospirillum oleiclasticum]NYZ14945.1 O-antigen ligase family protein [Azospirillum oleiclasticum]NYZ22707.1 O-antigen ligase family protein [Azospirillum oleiclasticum]